MIYVTKYNQYIDENNQLVSEADLLAYLEANGTVLPTDFVFPNEPLLVAELKEQAIKDQVALAQQLALESVITQAQTLSDTDAVAVQAVYPLWDSFADKTPAHWFTPNFKVNDFEGIELCLYRIITPHAWQLDRKPSETPALWSKIIIGGDGIEVWTQPIGGDGKYPLIDPLTSLPYEVKHNTITWRNRRTLNTSEPGTASSGWLQVSSLPAPWYFLGNEGYPLDWEVTHNGNTWKNNNADNTWEPGVFGWSII
jgi:hypothetical protein